MKCAKNAIVRIKRTSKQTTPHRGWLTSNRFEGAICRLNHERKNDDHIYYVTVISDGTQLYVYKGDLELVTDMTALDRLVLDL